MEAISTGHRHGHPARWLGLTFLLLLPGCLGEDEELHRQMKTLRAELKGAQERAADAESRAREAETQLAAVPKTSAVGDRPNPQALEEARKRIAELESQLAAARAEPPPTVAPAQTAESYKALAKELQSDLMQKVSDLSDLVQQQLPSADVQDVTIKRIRPPEEVATAFSSAITFTLLNRDRQAVPLSFPVQAGLDGTWKIPSIEDIKRGYSEVSSGNLSSSSMTHSASGTTATNTTDSTGRSGGQGAAFVKQADGSILVNWDGPSANTASRSASPTAAPTPAPPRQTPTTAPSHPPTPAAPQAPTIPAPVMPVQQDIIVRFE